MRGMSRCVIVPFSEQIPDVTPRQILCLNETALLFADCLPKLLSHSADDTKIIANTVEELHPNILGVLNR